MALEALTANQFHKAEHPVLQNGAHSVWMGPSCASSRIISQTCRAVHRRLQVEGEEGKTPRSHILNPLPMSILAGMLAVTHFISCMPTGQMKNTAFVVTTTFSIQLLNA